MTCSTCMLMTKTHDRHISKVITLYHRFGWKRYFAKLRFWYAPFVEVEKLLPEKGTILDLGCGEGILTSYIALSSPERKTIGIEIDQNRINQAPQIFPNVTFQQGDITKTYFPKSDAMILFHVLHHLPSFDAQEKLLQKCYQALKPHGKLIIVEVNVKPSIKYFLTWFTDNFLVAWIFEKRIRAKIFFRKKTDWEILLKKHGFSFNVYYGSRYKLFSNVIFECSRL